ncbi:MAG: integrase arm-type DNA-binding domain-containing protein [Desulfuromonadaceae bacterium]|nr:integrase arm-type DNA-binding domain-containing protein [Desulfuromonadaceae bacterium]
MGKQFTEKAIAAAKPKNVRYYLREGRGFALQVLPSGAKAFVYLFELNKSKGYVLLGHYPDCSLANARIAYNDAYKLVKNGIDPRDQKKADTEELRKKTEEIDITTDVVEPYTFTSLMDDGIPVGFIPSTVEQLVAVYYVLYSKENHGIETRKNFLYAAKSGIIPSIGKMLITEVRRKDAITLIQGIASRAPGQSGNVLKAGRQIFEYALQREWIENQPFLQITKAVPKARTNVCERVLDDSEVLQAWTSISKSPSSDSVKRALKMILVTAQRSGEISQMHSDQINDRWWTIPAIVAKNKREHRVYLTDTALSLIGNRKGYIFPSDKGSNGHVAVNTLAQAINRGYLSDEIVKLVGTRKIKARKEPYFGMTPWSPHDLRRTARTNMPRVGVSDEHAEEVLNHTKPGIIGVYNKYRYDKEKEIALIAWEKFLLTLLNPVVQKEGSSA